MIAFVCGNGIRAVPAVAAADGPGAAIGCWPKPACPTEPRNEDAKRLLETGRAPVDEISAGAGHADTSFFRRLFKRLTGLTPGQCRRMFSAPGECRDRSA